MKKIILSLAVLAAAVACSSEQVRTIEVVPCPNEITMKSGSFNAAG